MSREAEVVLMEYYQRQRNSDLTESARSTVRLLESLIRLSEAHARLMLREVVSVQDAVFSIILVESSLATSAIGNNVTSALHCEFPDDPDAECKKKKIIKPIYGSYDHQLYL